MINLIDHIFGLAHLHMDEQLNIVYTVKFSNSSRLDNLFEQAKNRISELNSFYKELYSPFLDFETISYRKPQEEVLLLNKSIYKNLDLKNYEFIRLDYLINSQETEFVFTVSHIIADGISVVALAYYLFNNYTLDAITSYVSYSSIKKKFSNYIKQTSLRSSKLPKISNYLEIIKNKPTVTLKKREEDSTSVPDIVRTVFDKSVAREKSKKYKISRENYLLIKLAETVFKFNQDKNDSKECLINLTKNIRLNSINLIDEVLGNYSFRKAIRFTRQDNQSFKEYAEQYNETLNDRSYLPKLVQEWLALQKLNRLPKVLLNFYAKSRISNLSKFTTTFTYFPLRAPILFPVKFLEKYNTTLLDYTCFLRVTKTHVPCFFFHSDVLSNYSISLAFNHAFLDKTEAVKLLNLYKDSLMDDI